MQDAVNEASEHADLFCTVAPTGGSAVRLKYLYKIARRMLVAKMVHKYREDLHSSYCASKYSLSRLQRTHNACKLPTTRLRNGTCTKLHAPRIRNIYAKVSANQMHIQTGVVGAVQNGKIV